MSTKDTTKVVIVPLKSVHADPNQPRKAFPADSLHALAESIRKHGIKQPLTVTMDGDKYILLDGERRLRAAQLIGLKEVPIIIEEPKTETERLLIQFNIQQMHEEWSPVEKAHAIIKLSEALGMSIRETCESLAMTKNEIDRYTAFASLADMDAYVASEIPLDYAESIRTLRVAVKNIKENTLEQEFTKQDAKKLEARIIHGFKTGVIVNRKDLTNLKDSFTKNPKAIEQYMRDATMTPTALYLKTGAQGARALRNAVANSVYIYSHAQTFMKTRDVKITDQQLYTLKRAYGALKTLIDLVD